MADIRIRNLKGFMVVRPLDETLWRHAEFNMARRERGRLIRSGRIVPGYNGNPAVVPFVKQADGSWKPAELTR